MEGDYTVFGESLQKYLDDYHIPVAEVATTLGVNKATVYRWLKGSRPPIDALLKIVDNILRLKGSERGELLRRAGYQDVESFAIALAKISSPLAFEPETPGETLIVIAKFFVSTGNRDVLIHREIRDRIQQEARRIGETAVRVEIAPSVLESDQQKEAKTLGEQYNASLVVWGDDTGVRVTVNFLQLHNLDFEAANARISETKRTQIANPSEYNQFIVDDLPKRLTFLSLFAIGHKYYINEDYLRAITLIEEAIATLGNKVKLEGLGEAYFRLGWLNQHLADEEKAITNYNKAIALKPDYHKTYNNRGNAYYFQGRIDDAIVDYNKAIELKSDEAIAYNNRGSAYYAQGRIDDAIADYNQAIYLKPNFVEAYNNRSNAYAEQEIFKGIMFKKGFYIERPELIKVGVIAFFSSPEVEDIRELAIKISLLNTIPDTIEFTGTSESVDPHDLSDDIVKPAEYAHRKSKIGDNLLSITEVTLARRRNAICIFLTVGSNPNGEKCFTYITIRFENINHLVKMIQEGRINRSIMNSVVHYGLGTPSQKDMESMFDNYLFTSHKTTVKYLTQEVSY